MELIRTVFVGVWKLLVSFSASSIVLFLTFSPVSDLRSFNISLWDSKGRFLISDVISSFKETLKLSKTLFSTLGDFGFDGPTTSTSWSKEQEFSAMTGEAKPSLTFLTTSY